MWIRFKANEARAPMRLFLAEKPSLGRAIADVLPPPHKKTRTFIECGDGNVVAWCAGHILETAPPEAYAPAYKSWRLGDLPIAPTEWKLSVSAPALLKGIQALLKDATRVVHAGDPDREGQLLVDEVLLFLGYKGPVDRLLVRDLRPDAVRRALGALEPNAKYLPLYESALARQRADWLYGMNMTRLYTLLGRSGGYDGVLSVGRVQTPLLGLIVARDRAIEQFKPVPYYAVSATIEVATGASFRARWAPGAAVEAHLDEDKRLLIRAVAERVRARTQGQPGVATACSQDPRSEAPPLPYALADLQMDAAKRLGLSAQAVLDACQSLYETHRLATYPRSDCSYLPEGHFAQANDVVDAIRAHAPTLAQLAANADLSLRSSAWNDKKVTAHHAILPTPNAAPAHLGDTERAVYELIGRRYLAQFYPPFETLQTTIEIEVAQERFVATGRQILSQGWKAARTDGREDDADGAHASESEDSASLPPLHPGDAVTATAIAIADKRTQPPKAFTDASIIQAMCQVAKFVRHPSIKKILTEADGIGTPATRAAIVETLFERDYIVRVKKTIVSTPTGRALIQSLPEVATTPDMTAVWEAGMRAITEGRQPLDAFLGRVHAELAQLVEQGKVLGCITVGERHACPEPGCPGPLRRLKGKSGFFWSCALCRTTADDRRGKPVRSPTDPRTAHETSKASAPIPARGAP
jgi:DNA topoisomerase-3